MSDLKGVLGISKAMLFAYRGGKNPITQKVWLKLKIAEEECEHANQGTAPTAESSTDPKHSGVRETTHSLIVEPLTLREDASASRAEVDPVTAAFAKIREGLDLLEQLMKNPPK